MARFLLFLAVAAVSTAATLVHYAAPAPALTVAAARVSLTAIILAFVAPRAWLSLRELTPRERVLVLLSGLLLGAHFGVWISSLYLTSTAASVTLVCTQPIFAVLFARALGDAIHSREIAGMGLALLGFAALGGGEILSGSTDALIGDFLALCGAATAAGYLLLGRRLRHALPLSAYLAMVNTVAGVALIIAAWIADARFLGFENHVYLAMVLAAIVPSLVGHTLLNWSVRRIPAHLVSLALLGEPIGASFLTWVAFAEVPPAHAVLGGAVVILGIAMGLGRRSPR